MSPAWGLGAGGWQELWQLEQLGRTQEVGPRGKRSKVECDKEVLTLRSQLRGAEVRPEGSALEPRGGPSR